jgi:hypothetical protein
VFIFSPTLISFNFHWNVGLLPPFMGFAVNVTDVPEHMEPGGGVMVTAEITFGITAIVISLDVAVGLVTQARDEVMVHVTFVPFANNAV